MNFLMFLLNILMCFTQFYSAADPLLPKCQFFHKSITIVCSIFIFFCIICVVYIVNNYIVHVFMLSL